MEHERIQQGEHLRCEAGSEGLRSRSGAFAFTGNSAALTRQATLSAGTGAFALTGFAALLQVVHPVTLSIDPRWYLARRGAFYSVSAVQPAYLVARAANDYIVSEAA